MITDVFTHLIEEAAVRGLLDLTYGTDSTDIRMMPALPDDSRR